MLAILHKWLQALSQSEAGTLFAEFESVLQKTRHAFRAIPCRWGLLTPCNKIIRLQPTLVYVHHNKALQHAIQDCCTLVRESTKYPTPCHKFIMGEPDFMGIEDASLYGIGGIIVGHRRARQPTVFCLEWPPDRKQAVLNTNSKHRGYLTNSDLEMAGLLFLWLAMEDVCNFTPGTHIILFSDNSPTISWEGCLAAWVSPITGQLIHALALCLNVRQVSLPTPHHIASKGNALTDIPSWSFGSEPR